MSFSQYESTPSLGFPVELFEFFAEGVYYRYVSHDEDVTTPEPLVWSSAIISRSSFSRGSELSQAEISVTTDLDLPLMDLFSAGMPEGPVQLKLYRMHLTDPDMERHLLWEGQITTRKRADKEVTLRGEIPEVSMQSLGLRKRYQTRCPYQLYSTACGVNKYEYAVLATVVSVDDSKTLNLSIADCSPFLGGYFTATISNHLKQRYISNGVGGSITTTRETPWATPGTVLTLYPGCDKSLSNCISKFGGNHLRFGGYPYMPETNPFNTQVY